MVILPCRGVWLWWQMCSHFMWRTGGKTDLPLVALYSEGSSFPSFTAPFAPRCFCWSFTTSGNSPVLHGIISVGFFDGPFGTPANRTAWNSPCSPPRHLVQQHLQAGSNSNASIHFHNALIFQGSDHRFQIKRSPSLEVKLPAVSVP